MTDIERAIKHFQNVRDGAMVVLDSFGHKPNESPTLYKRRKLNAELAISALEKQIPKKPIKQIWVDDEKHKGDVRLATKDDVLTKDNHGSINLCPNCKEWVMRYKYLSPPKDRDYYCKHCGQAIDWSDII